MDTADFVEFAAHELYAGGPWGEFFSFADGGVRAITDAHTMDVYRLMVRDVMASLMASEECRACGNGGHEKPWNTDALVKFVKLVREVACHER